MPAHQPAPPPTDRPLPRLAAALERATRLDPLAGLYDRISRTVVPSPGRVHDELRGRSVGHPVHSVLTDLPIGLWTSALALDVTRPDGHATAARRLVGLGLLAAPPTALTGLADYRALSEPARRVAAVHATCNGIGTVLALASWRARRSGHDGLGSVLTLAGMGVVGAAGYLGGHVAQAMREPRHVPGTAG
ncbi:DUF2231 domain-containing protein [Krasilnikoviella flava]|uniref:Uncharacterized membrane protein n=1 Tax=Krasilnikoviella flava TaxID=526729 RepID=A0A1T5IR16_9MICO|nr:DUF2231 domain-containing protein [Krasilnikoviella flava]SKC41634.1 Uncharacterized membrane protein [Krasilnikoviella flava]